MLARLQAIWEEVVTGLWLVPSLMALAAVGLAWATANVPLDQFNPSENWWLSSGDPQSVTELLSALLMSMITLATLAISITMIVLTLAAGSMGPRIIRSFMGDKRSQLMLGYFLGTVIYLILAMRAVHDAGDEDNVHHLAATASTVLSIGCVFFLLLFVHHLGRSIIADTVIQWVGERLDLTLKDMLPEEGKQGPESEEPEVSEEEGAVLSLQDCGYVQAIEYEKLAECARQANVLIALDFRPGEFLLPHGDHGRIFPRSAGDDRLAQKITDHIALGGQRTSKQDLEFAIRQLVDLALRALSPGINDPYTAIAVIDRLALFIAEVMRRAPAPSVWCDKEGKPRVIGRTTTFRGLVDNSFNQIRQSGARPSILIRLMRVLLQLAVQAHKPEHREVLADHVELVLQAGERTINDPYDLAPLERDANRVRRLLSEV